MLQTWLAITLLSADGGGVAEEQILGGQEGPLRGALQEGAVRADQEAARYAGAGLQDVPLQDGRLQPQGEGSRQQQHSSLAIVSWAHGM